ncbi:MAG: tRNA pseudouridine(55) synthase TruB [Anaerolineae bacterium]|nr:tRNA pseudouridine(55) synthase TruB [Anaerolineae bacterium]
MPSPTPPAGFLNLDKPVGITSHDVVARCRKILGTKKIGHAGTLDPQASGVLILCIGSATRLSEYVMASTKQYRATIHLGRETTTYDIEGEITAENPVDHIRSTDIESLLQPFIGEIEQLPPAYSAIKQGGKKLYELARAGKSVELTPRKVVIHEIQIVEWQPPLLSVNITCGAGTYIRSIAHDLGAALGVGGSLHDLRRTASGAFQAESAIALDALQTAENPPSLIISPAAALSDWHSLIVNPDEIVALRQGKTIPRTSPEAVSDLALAIDTHGETIAVLQAVTEGWKPHKVLST